MNIRRGLYLVLVAASATSLIVIYDSTPGPGAPHHLNGGLLTGCAIACACGLVAFVADSFIAKWYQNHWGLPYPVASCQRDDGSLIFTLRRLARIEDRVAARVIQPDKSSLEAAVSRSDLDSVELRFPARFHSEVILVKGTYRVHWFPIRVRPGSSEYLDVIAKAKIRVKKTQESREGSDSVEGGG
jgi:hypothetical protein